MSEFDTGIVEQNLEGVSLDGFIDDGGQSQVYLGEENGQDIVVKVSTFNSLSSKRRLRRAVENMQEIEDEGLAEILDYEEAEIGGQEVFIIKEEFVPGEDLSEIIEDGRCSFELGLNVFTQILDVLKKLDERDIVHRDIKPDNIRVQEDEVTLLDVGIARFNRKESITSDNEYRGPGTPAYSPPEVLTNEKEYQDVRTDFFSLALTVYRAITGNHPYNVPQYRSIQKAILKGDRRDLYEGYPSGESEDKLLEILSKLMNYHAYKREYRKPEQILGDMKDGGII